MVVGTRIMCGSIFLCFFSSTFCTNRKEECNSCLVGNPGYRYNSWNPGLWGPQLFFAEIDHDNVSLCCVHQITWGQILHYYLSSIRTWKSVFEIRRSKLLALQACLVLHLSYTIILVLPMAKHNCSSPRLGQKEEWTTEWWLGESRLLRLQLSAP